MKYKIATLGSHSALQILKGAHDEGFKTIAICEEGTERPYKSFGVADKIITVKSFADFFKVEDELIEENAIIIPHGTFTSVVSLEKMERLKVPHYGNKKILKWEADRNMCMKWLKEAGVRVPKMFDDPKDIDRPVIVKYYGARGGQGYFFCSNVEQFHEKIKNAPNVPYIIQEYIIGVPVYTHFFYSPLNNELEIMGFDKRYESNVDSIGRVAASDQIALNLQVSYTIVGNIPLVIRESFLPEIFEIGDNVVKASQKLEPPGLYGPFCIESIITPDQKIYVFEISARIVAGTNPFIEGSPYTALKYNEPMSCGRRIARELKLAIQNGRLNEVLG
ncbi:MAG: formate--phosphoribosylaminoimidazolecarboxamide ligase [Nanoarchaeota archaeon]